eukprot:scaffold108557_cov41-Prasinocladus_malaysianus.AAC.2
MSALVNSGGPSETAAAPRGSTAVARAPISGQAIAAQHSKSASAAAGKAVINSAGNVVTLTFSHVGKSSKTQPRKQVRLLGEEHTLEDAAYALWEARIPVFSRDLSKCCLSKQLISQTRM